MKTILRLIGGMLVGACFGLIIVIPLIAVIEGESITSVARTIFTKFSLQDVVDIAWMLIAVMIAFILSVVLHEGGHLVAGLLFCVTIVGIPWGTQHFKMALGSVFPFGKEIRSV